MSDFKNPAEAYASFCHAAQTGMILELDPANPAETVKPTTVPAETFTFPVYAFMSEEIATELEARATEFIATLDPATFSFLASDIDDNDTLVCFNENTKYLVYKGSCEYPLFVLIKEELPGAVSSQFGYINVLKGKRFEKRWVWFDVNDNQSQKQMWREVTAFSACVFYLKHRDVPVEYVVATPGSTYTKINARLARNGKPLLPMIRTISLDAAKKVYLNPPVPTGTGSPKAEHDRRATVRHYPKGIKSGPFRGCFERPVKACVAGRAPRKPTIIKVTV